jgi:hypothetical protein
VNLLLVEAKGGIALFHGPWRRYGHFGSFTGAAREMFTNMDHSWVIYRQLYERITLALNKGVQPAHFSTEAHIVSVWEDLAAQPIFHDAGAFCKSERWWDVEKRIPAYVKFGPCILLVLLYIGITEAWWQSIYDTPLAGIRHIDDDLDMNVEGGLPGPSDSSSESSDSDDDDAVKVVEPPAAMAGLPSTATKEEVAAAKPAHPKAVAPAHGPKADDAEHEKKPVKVAEADSNVKMAIQKNNMMVVAHSLANSFNDKVLIAIHWATAASRSRQGVGLHDGKTQTGCLKYYTAQASGDYYVESFEMFSLLSNPETLREIGFSNRRSQCPDELRENAELSSIFFDLMLGQFRSNLGYFRQYTDRPPGIFAGFCDAASRPTTGLFCCNAFHTLHVAEEQAKTDPWLKAFMKGLLWPSSPFCLDVIIAVVETGGNAPMWGGPMESHCL